MSNFSQFLGSSVDYGVGDVVIRPNFTANLGISTFVSFGQKEYIALGNVRTYDANYAPLFATAAYYCLSNTLLGNLNWSTSNTSSTFGPFTTSKVEKASDNYFHIRLGKQTSADQAYIKANVRAVANGTDISLGTGLTAYSNIPNILIFNSAYANYATRIVYINDSITFKNTVFVTGNYFGDVQTGTDPNYGDPIYGEGAYRGLWRATVNTFALHYGAYESAGSTVANGYFYTAAANSNICVFLRAAISQTSGHILTTSDASSYTARTMSGVASFNPARAVWSTPGNCYIYVSTTGAIYTSTDGYTLTTKTAPSGMPSTVNIAYGSTMLCATSGNATVIHLANGVFLQTTNANGFNLIDLSKNSALNAHFNEGCDTNVFVIFDGTRFVATAKDRAIAYANTIGSTWTMDAQQYNAAFVSNTANSRVFSCGMSYVNQNTFITIHSGQGYDQLPTVTNSNAAFARATPDFVGSPYSMTIFSATSNVSAYLRIR